MVFRWFVPCLRFVQQIDVQVLIRVDASIQIGSGHVMRCLTLADELHREGLEVHFICRNFPGQMEDVIRKRGHSVTLLSAPKMEYEPAADDPAHAHWLGLSWERDAEEVERSFSGNKVDWLIVDHYAIDRRWHKRLRSLAGRIMVIDDLADRKLDCDLLLDQTYGRSEEVYRPLVPDHCRMLLGAGYALLRPEFARLRSKALDKRRRVGSVMNVMISMGSMDPDNVTGQVLDGLALVDWPVKPLVNVVLGGSAPHLQTVREQSDAHDLQIKVLTDVTNMAELMLEADFSIGAGGATSWERCCMGLPALVAGIAVNQREILRQLGEVGALIDLGNCNCLSAATIANEIGRLLSDELLPHKMSNNAFAVCDGLGVQLVGLALYPLLARDGNSIGLRDVHIGDARIIHKWQQAPETRRYANNPQVPEWEGHVRWMNAKIQEVGSYFWIIKHGDASAGVLRLDPMQGPDGDSGRLISILVAPEKYRLGLGRGVLSIAQHIFTDDILFAEILPANQASRALFESVGFVRQERNLFVWKPR